MPRRAVPVEQELQLLGEALVSPEAVALFLGIGRSTAYRLAGRVIPCIKIGDRVRFRPSDVRAYLERNTVRSSSPSRVERLLARDGGDDFRCENN